MRAPRPAAVDFETEAIEGRPHYPPRPVGVAVKEPGRAAEYLAWGHPSGNNCTREDARRRLRALWRGDVAFHNGKFDQDVAETHLGLPRLPHDRAHDTLLLAFLHDPHSASLSLKPLAERHLGARPLARDELRDWVIENVPEARQRRSQWGAHISKAPGELVGRYAAGTPRRPGDAYMTERLFAKLWRDVSARGMLAAYDRERRLLPVLLDAERRGLYVDLPALRRAAPEAEALLGRVDAMAAKMLGARGLDLDSNDELAAALERADAMEAWEYTPGGQRSVAKSSLLAGLRDPGLKAVLVYRGALATMLRTFLAPWLRQAEGSGGVVYTNWNQVRQSHREGPADAGARTGRLSSNPNLQNIPTDDSPNYSRVASLVEAAGLSRRLPPLPLCRNYVAAPRGKRAVNRDYSQQELRILGHYEGGVLAEAYAKDPWLDVHTMAQKLIIGLTGADFGRRAVKDCGFGLIYGMGVNKLADKTGTDAKTAAALKKAYLEIFPGLRDLQRDLKARAAEKRPIRTWGGREYFCEEPKVQGGRLMTFEYKLLNVLIQGSAADCTKQAVVNLEAHPRWRSLGGEFAVSVHDELLCFAPAASARGCMDAMREAMEAVEFDVPMLSEGEWGRAWGSLEPYKDRR